MSDTRLRWHDLYHDAETCTYTCSVCGWNGPKKHIMLVCPNPMYTEQFACCPVCHREGRTTYLQRIAETRFRVPFRLKHPDDVIRRTAKALRDELAGKRNFSLTDLELAADILESLVQ